MDTIESTLNQLTDLLQKLYGLPAGALVIVGCVVLGYVLRFWKGFPNQAIPVAVILFGGVVFPVIADANNDLTLRVWLVRNLLIGLAIGFIAWIAHNKFLKPIEDKFFPPDPPPNP